MAKNNHKTVESEEEQEERESQIEDFCDHIGLGVYHDVSENPKAFDLTERDINQSTNKFNQTVCDEIEKLVQEEFY